MANATQKTGSGSHSANRVQPQSEKRPETSAEGNGTAKKRGRPAGSGNGSGPVKKTDFPGARPFTVVPDGWSAKLHKQLRLDDFGGVEKLLEDYKDKYGLGRNPHPQTLDANGNKALLSAFPEDHPASLIKVSAQQKGGKFSPLKVSNFADPLVYFEAELTALKSTIAKRESTIAKLRSFDTAEKRLSWYNNRKGAGKVFDKAIDLMADKSVRSENKDSLRTLLSTFTDEELAEMGMSRNG